MPVIVYLPKVDGKQIEVLIAPHKDTQVPLFHFEFTGCLPCSNWYWDYVPRVKIKLSMLTAMT